MVLTSSLALFLVLAQPVGWEQSLQTFWQSSEDSKREEAAAAILASDASFDEVYARLEKGPLYSAQVPRGPIEMSRTPPKGEPHAYVVWVPESYDPDERHPVRVFLHGGVDRPAGARRGDWWRRYQPFQSQELAELAVFPIGWDQSLWWQASQTENLQAILDELKRLYNVDENRVTLYGVSDGATGVYFQALRAPTSWAAFLPFIGHAGVLANPSVGADGDLYAVNASNRPLFIVNAEQDPLYPVSRVMPYVKLFRQVGTQVTFRRKDGGHDTNWWKSEVRRVERFIDSHPRDPLPDGIVWETERTDRYHRFAWLVIEALGEWEGEAELPDVNSLEIPAPPPVLGVELDFAERLVVREVEKGSLAEGAGVKSGDVLLSFDGEETPTVERLGRALSASLEASGYSSLVPLEVERDGKRMELEFRHPDAPTPELEPAFLRSGPSGRIELERKANEVTVRTRGVSRYRLLLSPAQFDFDQPIRVVTNGRVSFEGRVPKRLETLVRWALRDRDREMLFAAELSLSPAGLDPPQ